MKTIKKFLLATVAAAALAPAAQAADMPVKARPAVVATVYNWSGFYVGVHGGGAWGKLSGIYDTGGAPGGPNDTSRIRDSGPIFGAQGGYNFQSGMFVFGVELDATKGFYENSLQSADTFLTNTSELDYMWSARGRFGVALGDRGRWLPFVTAGWGQVVHKFGAFGAAGVLVGVNDTIRVRKSGFVGGGGLEYGLMDKVSLRVEYLHYAARATKVFGDEELIDSNAGDTIRYRAMNVVRGAINFKISPW